MTATPRTILVVEDEDSERDALARVLRLEKYLVVTARNPAEALTKIALPIDMVISDLRMGRHTGVELLQSWRQERPQTPFLLLTAFGTVETAVQAMKLGASDFLSKPVDPEKLLDLVQHLVGSGGEDPEHLDVLNRINAGLEPMKIVGGSRSLIEVCLRTLRAAQAASTVLILGESGTGKELIASAIHRHSPRHEGPFVVVNMAAIPEPLVESELFGHVKGAFTSAINSRVGRFEAAKGGTLFIDEIGDFPLGVQAKLLRVLETRRVTPVGSEQDQLVDVRIVAATSRPLAKMVQSGEFREDLFYRLNVITLDLPPLRQRRAEIPILTQYFLQELAQAGSRPPLRVAPDLLRTLEQYDWPGNVRQLRNCLERMSVFAEGDLLTLEDLPEELRRADESLESQATSSRMESLKRSAILDAIAQFSGNRTRAAEFLGISVRTLQRKLRDWGMASPPAD